MDSLIPLAYIGNIPCGGKADGLRCAQEKGVHIPETFCIPLAFHKRFLDEGNNSEQWIVDHLLEALEILPCGTYAVRSSSEHEDSKEHSYAGVFESILDVERDAIPQAVKKVWGSVESVRAGSYSEKERLMGIVIQPMIFAKRAGVFFSKNPSPTSILELDTSVIEYVEGAGEQLVQGEVTPRTCVGTKAELSSRTLGKWYEELASYAALFPDPVDMEFVVDQDEVLYVVQQRPISTKPHVTHLDLTAYERRYKRELKLLDVQLLIEGCARHLPRMLDCPVELSKWMVLTVAKDGTQELWVNVEKENAVISHLIERLQSETFRNTLHTSYQSIHLMLKNAKPFSSIAGFVEAIYEWQAHYYLPMFVIDALYALLQKEMPDDPLFFLSTYDIPSLLECAAIELEEGVDVEKVHAAYSFLNCHQVDAPGFTKEEIAKLTRQKGKCEDEKYEALLTEYVRGKSHEQLFFTLREWIRIRNQDMEYLYKVYYDNRSLFEQEAAQRGMTLSDFWDISTQEIRTGTKGPYCTAIARIDGETQFFHVTSVAKEDVSHTGLQGKTVFGSGVMQGTVVKAFHPDDVHAQESSSPLILVTGMTTPDFIPVLKRYCAALVTDEGGILCHAAILARECGIPCIVGTGHATENLETGQAISLDFQTGRIT